MSSSASGYQIMEELPNDDVAIIESLYEIEIESDNQQQPPILGKDSNEEVKETISKAKVSTTASSSSSAVSVQSKNLVPPLRPLNIAPKPPEQIPIAVKTVNGQPVLLLPGSNSNQTIKLINTRGEEINLANYSINQPTVKTVKSTAASGGVSRVTSTATGQSKPIFIKKVSGQKSHSKPITISKSGGQQLLVIQKSTGNDQQIKLIQANGPTVTSSTAVAAASSSSGSNGSGSGIASIQGKALTLQQAQELGLISNAKIIHSSGGQQQLNSKRTVLINKTPQKTIVKPVLTTVAAATAAATASSRTTTAAVATTVATVSKTTSSATATSATATTTSCNTNTSTKPQSKQPAKILPATASTSGGSGKSGGQRIILKNASGQVLPAGQYIQVTSTQGLAAGGQIHQINVPGKGVQYIRFVSSTTTAESTSTTATVKSSGGTTETKTSNVQTKLVSKLQTPSSSKQAQLIVVPAGYIATAANIPKVPKVPIPPMKSKSGSASRPIPIVPAPTPGSIAENLSTSTSSITSQTVPPDNAISNNNNNNNTSSSTTNGIRPRKPCNCTKSQCLKLYCDCFANGEFCYLCNCMNCFNNLDNEEIRNLSIKSCLDRNPNAFRPKIGKAKDTGGDVLRKHTKGCNCKRSGCLKNYCECYEAKISCSNNCKCVGCRNVEDILEKKAYEANCHRLSDEFLAQKFCRRLLPTNRDNDPSRTRKLSNSRKQTISFITDDVIEATCQCLLTISDDGYSNMQNEELTKRQIIEEFGGCLTEIIHCSLNRNSL